MGYYNHHVQKKKKASFLCKKSMIIGMTIGAFIAIASLVISSNFLLPNTEQALAAQEEEEPKQETVQQIYQTDIYTEIIRAIEKVSGAVVGVSNIKENIYFFEQQQVGTGSGVIYKKVDGKAFIVTNNHVVDGASKVEVTLNDGTKEPAKIIGTDVYTDLAVLQIDGEHVSTVAELGSSENLKLGEPVLAIGNPLGPRFSGSVTQGIVSGLERTIPIDLDRDGSPDWEAEVIQTDAAINPGNSGGALVNIKGEVIGINSMKIARYAVEGIGLAIPISTVKPIIEDLEMYHEVRRPFMGVGLKPLSEIPGYHWEETLHLPSDVTAGVVVLNVVDGSPAAQAGLERLDVIVKLDDTPVKDQIDVRKYLYRHKKIGDKLEITYYRNGDQKTTTLQLNHNTY